MCVLTSAHHGDVRLALGLSSDDTTTLPANTIDSRVYGGIIQARVTAALECCAEVWSCDSDDDLYDAAKTNMSITALVYLTAAAIAEGHLAAKADARIKSERLGNQAVTYDATDWTKTAGTLFAQGIMAMRAACPCAADELAGDINNFGACDLMSFNGPSWYAPDQDEIDDRIDQTIPWVIGGP